ncbi:hypothetical protein [Micromonospora aurantiaca (nom. illeg.)]|uniref:hypothetical protein n=1 Tax=Micromonospora aurantiaca (nom. illeg.) TaxID=47850 RepID=UPI00379CC429
MTQSYPICPSVHARARISGTVSSGVWPEVSSQSPIRGVGVEPGVQVRHRPVAVPLLRPVPLAGGDHLGARREHHHGQRPVPDPADHGRQVR